MEPPGTIGAESPEKIILRWDSTAADDSRDKMIFEGDRYEIERYLSAVDELQKSMDSVTISDPSSTVSSALQIAMARLEDEFRNILLSHTSPIETESLTDPSTHSSLASRSASLEFSTHSREIEFKEEMKSRFAKRFEHSESNSRCTNSCYKSTSSIGVDLFPADAINDLRCIAVRIIAAGYSRECVQVYASVRKSAVEASFKKLGIEKMSIGDIHSLEWKTLDKKIRRWIGAAKICVRVLFVSEKRLCEQIFEGLENCIDDVCFMETIKDPAIQLFNFAEAISISTRSPEKLFRILDLHDALSNLLPDIDNVFESKSSESIKIQTAEILSRLAEAARVILSEFENAVLQEPSKILAPGGIHLLTRYVMNYISLISDYKQTLIELIVSKPSTGSRYLSDPNVPEMDFTEFEGQVSTLALHLIWIIVILQFNLDGKSKHYKDASLIHLFMMNNVLYIVQKIKGSPELREMIGDDYLRRLTVNFKVSATNYQRSTWVRLLHYVSGSHYVGGSVASVRALRKRLKSFNAMFEHVHRTHATWLIPDTQLRQELRISILEILFPAYRTFLARFRSHIERGNYIKYSVEDLENAVLDFFQGNPVSQHLRRRSQ